MRKLYLIAVSLLIIISASSQTTYTWKGGNGSWNSSSNWTPAGIPANNDIVRFNDGGIETISAIPSNYTLYRLQVTGNTNVTLEHTANRTFTIANNSGTDLIIDAGSKLTAGTNIRITLSNNAEAAIAGTLVITNGNFDTNNSGVLTTVTGILQNTAGTIAGAADKLTFASGGKFIHGRSGGTIPAATWAAASTCEITGLTNGDAGGDNQAFGNLVYNCPGMTGNRNLGGTGLSVAGYLQIINIGDALLQLPTTSLNIGGDLILNSGTFRIGNNTSRTVTVGGDVLITGGTLLMSVGNNVNDIGTLNIAGDFTQTGGLINEDNNGRGEIYFNGTSVQSFSKTGGTISNTINFTVNNNAKVDFNTSVLNGSSGSFTLQAGGKILIGSSNPIQVSGTKTFSSGADYEFESSVTGTFTTTPLAFTARDIIINKAGGVTLSQPMTVTRELQLQNGELMTSATNLITINDNAIASGYSNSSFITGPILKKGNDDFIFPVGRSGGGLVPIRISGLSGSSDFKAEYKRVPPLSAGSSISALGLDHLSACEYWSLDRTGSATANVTLYWNAYSNCNAGAYVTDLSTIVVAHSNGTSWNSFARNGGTTGTIASGTVTWNNVNTFSPFALGSTSAVGNPLPVILADVKAYTKNSGIQTEWSNLTEKDVVEYVVERSANGIDFAMINRQQARSNQNSRSDYTYFDASPLLGTNYYRIRINEISGKSVVSRTLRVETAKTNQNLVMYPNPVTGNQFNIGMTNTKRGSYKLQVINAAGQDVFSKTIVSEGTNITQMVQLPSTVKHGLYTLILRGDNYLESKMFIIK